DQERQSFWHSGREGFLQRPYQRDDEYRKDHRLEHNLSHGRRRKHNERYDEPGHNAHDFVVHGAPVNVQSLIGDQSSAATENHLLRFTHLAILRLHGLKRRFPDISVHSITTFTVRDVTGASASRA
ncbi:MAG: hypothetical protein WBO09_18805, partial [Methylocystis silviterrae]|uniref:hypothetical protein n=1 Tax=Methylocystis silviterrae TaxID=2743612 RepID=UPI003C76949B